jgi:hypothetical protein
MGVTADPVEHDLNLLAAFAEDRVSDKERARCFEHLAVCATCREILATLTREIKVDAVAKPSLSRRYTWLAIAATTVIAAGLAYRAMRPGQAPQPAPVTSSPTAPATPTPAGGQSVETPAAPAPPTPGGDLGGLSTRRGAERTVAGKTLRLVAGEWIDSAYEPTSTLPVVDIKTAESKADWLRRVPALAPYAALGNRVSVIVDGVVYRFDVPSR